MLASRCGSTRLAFRLAAHGFSQGGAHAALPRTAARCFASALMRLPATARASALCQSRLCRHFSSKGDIVEEKVPGFGAESITEGTVMEIKKSVGDGVAKGEVIAVIETDKVTVEVNAENSGTVKEILTNIDDTVEVGASLLKIEVGDPPAGGAPASAPATAAKAPAATPAATAVAVAPSWAGAIEGEPPRGLRAGFAHARALRSGALPQKPVAEEAVGAPAEPRKVETTGRGDRRVPMNLVRKIVGQRLKDAQNTAALLTTFNEVDMTAALELRSKYSELFEKTHGVQLGLLSLIVKATSAALMEIPGVNGIIDDATGEIVYRDYSDISVPIPSPRGVVSCTLADCHKTPLRNIEQKIADLMVQTRKDELNLADMMNPTFGITDSGSAGGMLGTNIINPPMSAAMGTNAVTQRAAVVNGKVVARPIMYISLTYDHRLIDGREAVLFLVSVKDKLEDPVRLLFDL